MRITIYLLALILMIGCQAENEISLDAKLIRSGPIRSHIERSGNILYVGSDDLAMVAYDLNGDSLLWQVNTTGPVRSGITVDGDNLFFHDRQWLYSIDKNTGALNWKCLLNETPQLTEFDPWDYHSGKPLVINEKIVIGTVYGTVLAIDKEEGNVTNEFHTRDDAAISCTPAVADNQIYFGDWNGWIYALQLESFDTLWTIKTYEVQPYETFGQLNSAFTVEDSLLAFGARNPELMILNRHTGKKLWSYSEPDGGWFSGIPLVSEDTLFIGGSDSHKQYAFNLRTGDLFWETKVMNNIFSAPSLYKDFLIITDGDAYSYLTGSAGIGHVYALDRQTGEMVNFKTIEGNLFSTPVIYGDTLFLGSDNGRLYNIDLERFISESSMLHKMGFNAFREISADPNPFFDSTVISIDGISSDHLLIEILDMQQRPIFTDTINNLKRKKDLIYTWYGNLENNDALPAGYYYLRIRKNEYFEQMFLVIDR